MITITQKARTAMNIVAALLWVVMLIANFFPGKDAVSLMGLICFALLTGIYFILGTTVEGKIGSKTPLLYPIIIMVILWIIGFSIAVATKGQKMDLIMGLHPGAFAAMAFFWIGTILTSTLSYFIFFDKYLLPEEKWDNFMKEVAQNQQVH